MSDRRKRTKPPVELSEPEPDPEPDKKRTGTLPDLTLPPVARPRPVVHVSPSTPARSARQTRVRRYTLA